MNFNLGQWQELSRYLPKRKIPEAVITFIEHTTEPLCVACSGGSDSIALLLLTKLFWSKRTVIVLHYNHRIRAVSDEEERQMIELAQQLKVKIEVGHRPIMSETHPSFKTTVAETTSSVSDYATTASEPTSLADGEKTTEILLKPDRLEFLPSEHNTSYPQNLLHPQTTGTIPQHPEAHARTFDISPNSEYPADTAGNPGERASMNRETSATACEQSRNLSSENRKNLSANHSNKAPTNHPLTFLPHPSLLKPDGSLSKLPSEANLRTLRYAFFEKMLRLYRSTVLLLGHHADDRLETVLMRLVRGVGPEGLVAPRALHKVFFYTKVRPLLNFSKNELRNALNNCGVSFFEDATNDEDDCLRNRIRHTLIPAFDKVFPKHWRDGFKRSCQLLSEQRDDLKQRLEQRFRQWDFCKKTFERSELQALSTVECRCFFQTWLQRHGVRNFGSQTIDTVCSALHEKETVIFPLDPEHRLYLDDEKIFLITQTPKPPKPVGITWRNGALFLPNGARLSFKEEHCSPERYKEVTSGTFSHNEVAVLDTKAFTLPYTVRFWQNGDRYRPLSAKSKVKVKDLFSARKIQTDRRHQLPFVCSANGDIAWIPGLPPSDAFKLMPQTKRCVFLFYQTHKMLYGGENGGEENTPNI